MAVDPSPSSDSRMSTSVSRVLRVTWAVRGSDSSVLRAPSVVVMAGPVAWQSRRGLLGRRELPLDLARGLDQSVVVGFGADRHTEAMRELVAGAERARDEAAPEKRFGDGRRAPRRPEVEQQEVDHRWTGPPARALQRRGESRALAGDTLEVGAHLGRVAERLGHDGRGDGRDRARWAIATDARDRAGRADREPDAEAGECVRLRCGAHDDEVREAVAQVDVRPPDELRVGLVADDDRWLAVGGIRIGGDGLEGGLGRAGGGGRTRRGFWGGVPHERGPRGA